MLFAILPDGGRDVLQRIVTAREVLVRRLRRRLPYGGRKGRAAALRLRKMGDWLYSPVDALVADLTGMPFY